MSQPRKYSVALLGNGGSFHIQRLGASLAARGHRIHVITADKNGPYPNLPGVLYREFDSSKPALARLAQIRRFIKEISPDILHSHFVNYGGFIGVATGFHPHIMSAWGCDILNVPQSSRLMLLKTNVALRAADALLPVSNQIRDRISTLLGAGSSATPGRYNEVYQWGIDTNQFAWSEEKARAFRSRFGLEDKTVVFSPRLLIRHDNQRTLVDAWPSVLEMRPDARLVILHRGSEPDYEKEIRARVRELGIESTVVWVDYLSDDDLVGAYCASGAIVSIPRTDGTSMTMLEAMSCGIPLVATDLPSTRDWITPSENGFLVQPIDPPTVAREILKALTLSDAQKQRLAVKARATIVERADRTRCLERLESIYENFCARPGFSWFKTAKNILSDR